MAGQEIFKYAVTQSTKDIHYVLDKAKVKASAVDYFVLHQANRRILETARVRLKQPAEKFPMNITTHGNTGSAGIPALLSEMVEDGRLQTGPNPRFKRVRRRAYLRGSIAAIQFIGGINHEHL